MFDRIVAFCLTFVPIYPQKRIMPTSQGSGSLQELMVATNLLPMRVNDMNLAIMFAAFMPSIKTLVLDHVDTNTNERTYSATIYLPFGTKRASR